MFLGRDPVADQIDLRLDFRERGSGERSGARRWSGW
jgi:hypothetical protein